MYRTADTGQELQLMFTSNIRIKKNIFFLSDIIVGASLIWLRLQFETTEMFIFNCEEN